MSSRRSFLTLALAAIMTLVGFTAFDVQKAQAKSPQVSGTLVALNVAARKATIQTQKNGNVVVSIPAAAKIERNNAHVTLAAFKIGDKVQAKYNAAGSVIIKFEGVGP